LLLADFRILYPIMPPLPRSTLTDAATQAIRERILGGVLVAGEPLRQEALAAELGVSRIPLREALQRLEAEGLVALVPHRGAVVSELPTDDALELFELRALIESDLLRRAVPLARPADYAAAIVAADHFADALGRGDIARLGQANLQFHLALYQPAGRRQTIDVYQRLHQQCDRLMRLQLTLTNGGAQAIREHAAIAAAVERGDADTAAQLTHAHILGAGERLVRALGSRHPSGAGT
jgi:DNA-binding GntR family transcriptional regulator